MTKEKLKNLKELFSVQNNNNFCDIIKPCVNEVYCDVLGNIIAHKEGVGKRIMLVAHQDVVRLMVTHVDENGFLYVQPAGSIDASILYARKIEIRHENTSIIGIIGKKPIHLLHGEQNGKVNYDNIWIDIGAKSKSEALQMVSKGDYAYFCSDFNELPNELIASSYIDNKVGLYVLQSIAKQLSVSNISSCDLYYVASNHEEIGMRGAIVAANSIKPDICICVDVAHAADYPTVNIICDGDIKLGDGCVLSKGPNIYPPLYKSIKEIAVKHKIAHQIDVSPYPTGTDANVIQLSGKGIKTAVVSIPCRYMHTPYEICSKKDIKSTIEIIKEFLLSEPEIHNL